MNNGSFSKRNNHGPVTHHPRKATLLRYAIVSNQKIKLLSPFSNNWKIILSVSNGYFGVVSIDLWMRRLYLAVCSGSHLHNRLSKTSFLLPDNCLRSNFTILRLYRMLIVVNSKTRSLTFVFIIFTELENVKSDISDNLLIVCVSTVKARPVWMNQVRCY